MIRYTDALARLLEGVTALPPESCSVADAQGRVLAAPVISPMALPSFDHAAMDGYAVSAIEPVEPGTAFLVHGSQAAGDGDCTAHGGAWEIMTGARLPAGLDAVVAVERVELLEALDDGTPRRIRVLDAVSEGQNVRHAGVDVAPGSTALPAGARVDAPQRMLLAALGVSHVAVVRRPRVAIIGTGKELQADPDQPLDGGRIHASNGPYLAATMQAAGATVLSCETVDDTAATYAAALDRALAAGADLVVSTGAVSMGRYDFVPGLVRERGDSVLFHKVAMRPGKPVLAATLAGGVPLLALPGTPMAVAAGARFFVAPLLRAMHGQRPEPVLHAVLATRQEPKAGLRHFLRARLQLDARGQLQAHVLGHQQPFRIYPYTEADAWVMLDEAAGVCEAGTPVPVASLEMATGLRVRPAGSEGVDATEAG